jgi:hypothetical protein
LPFLCNVIIVLMEDGMALVITNHQGGSKLQSSKEELMMPLIEQKKSPRCAVGKIVKAVDKGEFVMLQWITSEEEIKNAYQLCNPCNNADIWYIVTHITAPAIKQSDSPLNQQEDSSNEDSGDNNGGQDKDSRQEDY